MIESDLFSGICWVSRSSLFCCSK